MVSDEIKIDCRALDSKIFEKDMFCEVYSFINLKKITINIFLIIYNC